jgi:glycosyltransferase 2 family protein
MAARLRTLTNFVIGIVLTGILLYTAFRGTDFSELWRVLQSVKVWWALTPLPLLLISHFIRAWRWQLLLIPVKNRVSRGNAFSSLILGYMVNNVLPRAGELFRPYTLAKVEKIPQAASFGSVFLERLVDLISVLIGVGLIFLIFKRSFNQHFPWWDTVTVMVIAVSIGSILLIGLLLFKRELVVRLVQVMLLPFSDRFRKKAEGIFHSFVDGMMAIRERNNLPGIVLLTIAMWISYTYMAYLPLFAFDLGEIQVNIITGFVLMMVTSLSVLVPTPGATGSYHTFTVEVLTRLYGFQREVALGYATISHAIGYFTVIFLGLYYLVRYNFKVKEVLDGVDSQNGNGGTQKE